MLKPRKITGIVTLFLCLIFGLLLVLSNKKLVLSSEDKSYLDSFLCQWNIKETPQQIHADFNSEIAFLQNLESHVVHSIQHKEINHHLFGNVRNYFVNRKGFCYDRAALMEKFFLHFNFKFRHIFIYYPDKIDKEPALLDFFRKSTQSHAAVEVKTKQGWMLMDSNADWTGLSKNGKVFTIKDLKSTLEHNKKVDLKNECDMGTPFYKEHPKFSYVYGFYSRSGSFFSLHQGLPEIDIRMLPYNL